jgi:hypothetical protein
MPENTHNRTLHAPCPPKDIRPYVRTITAPEGGGGVFACLHNSIFSHMMHWIDGHSFPCRYRTLKCEACEAGHGSRWEGFIGVQNPNTTGVFILKITAGAYRNSPHLVDLDAQEQLRGKLLKCERMGEQRRRNAPARITVLNPNRVLRLPEPFDLAGALARSWGLTSLAQILMMDCDNPHGTCD